MKFRTKSSFHIFFSTILLGTLLHTSLSYADILLSEISKLPSDPESITLDFDAAAKKTIDQSFSLSISQHDIEIKKGIVEQSRLYPNPTFNYNLQTSEFGWNQRQDIYSLSQLIEWEMKRQKKIETASNEYYASLAGYDLTKLERLNKLCKAFIATASAQEHLRLAVEMQKNAEEMYNIAHSKLEAGKISILENNRTELTKRLAHLNIHQAASTFQTAKHNVMLVLSQRDEDFDLVSYPFYDISPPKPLEDYLSTLCSQPEIIRSFYQYQAACSNLSKERSEVLPDVTITLGYSYDGGDNGLIAGIGVPIPIWNQNQGNIRKARAEMLKMADQQKQLWLLLEIKLRNAYVEMSRSYQEAEEIKNNLLKIAEDHFDLSLEGYREGKFEYLNVLEAKHSLFEIRERYIETLTNYHHKKTEIQYINSLTN